MTMNEEYKELYYYILNSGSNGKMRLLGGVVHMMMEYLIKHDQKTAREMLDIMQSAKWDNYLTEKEAETIIAHMTPSPKWDMKMFRSMMEQAGAPMAKKPCYNECALFVTMCMVDSDSGKTIAKMMGREGVASNDMEYFLAVHSFAIDKLCDEDGVFDIRNYFKDVLWPDGV